MLFYFDGLASETIPVQRFSYKRSSYAPVTNDLKSFGHKFTSYFIKEKAEIIRESATADIRSMCGLGFPPKVYTQNASECMNRLVKAEEDSKFAKKAGGLLSAIEQIRTEVKRQNEEQFLAVIGRGEYNLTNDFLFLLQDD